MSIWNPWHGCHKISPGCQNCYVYRRDESIGKDTSVVTLSSSFDLPLRHNRNLIPNLKYTDGEVFTCMTSDFFIEEADEWRSECWEMMKTRKDLKFSIITKRIHRFNNCIPSDWNDGYENVTILCTCENQKMADYRLPIFLSAPIRHKKIIIEPMLEKMDIRDYLSSGQIESVTCGGESGPEARTCDYDWILSIRQQCLEYKVPFNFKQTGYRFVKDGKLYRIPRHMQQEQASKADINHNG